MLSTSTYPTMPPSITLISNNVVAYSLDFDHTNHVNQHNGVHDSNQHNGVHDSSKIEDR